MKYIKQIKLLLLSYFVKCFLELCLVSLLLSLLYNHIDKLQMCCQIVHTSKQLFYCSRNDQKNCNNIFPQIMQP